MARHSVAGFERVIAFLTYVTAGWAGLIYCVIMYFKKRNPTHFIRYNVFQSIFVSLLLMVLSMSMNVILTFLSIIPFINYLVAQISFWLNRELFFNYSIIQVVVLGLVLYMAIVSAIGKYPRIYWVSKIIDRAA